MNEIELEMHLLELEADGLIEWIRFYDKNGERNHGKDILIWIGKHHPRGAA